MSPTPDQLAAFEALLRQARQQLGAAADDFERRMRRIWDEDDPESVLRALVITLRDHRAEQTQCEQTDEHLGPS